MQKPIKTLIIFSTSWGPKFGGINSFNFDLVRAFAAKSFVDTRTICVVLDASELEIQQAKNNGVILISLGNARCKEFEISFEPAVWEKIQSESEDFDATQTVWLGHDRITGGIALEASKKRGGKSAIIHHMSYELYEAFAETSALAKDKEDQQRSLFSQADIALAVGPLLRDALGDMLDSTVPMLVPGLADISATGNSPKRFRAFLSGRLSEDAKKVKQAHLGVAAFSKSIQMATTNTGLPDCLQSEKQPKLTLRGVDFENREGNYDPEAEEELKKFAEEYAGCVFPLHALPFTTDRKVLFDDLRTASIALMPSWHDGFGLVAWEAIAAGVPLIISKKCGAYQLLKEFNNGIYESLFTSVDVKGSNTAPFFRDDDQIELSKAIIQIAKNPDDYKNKAIRLREDLLKEFTWANCALQLSNALGWCDSTAQAKPTELHEPAKLALIPASVSSNTLGVPAFAVEFLSLPTPKWHLGSGLSDSQLLRAEEAIIQFDPQREPFLETQLTWAHDTTYPIAVRLLTGAGGVGKTRLAIEMCQRLQEQGFQAGFLSDDLTGTKASNLAEQIANCGKSCCVVIDYAETRQTVLLALLKELQSKAPKHGVRILLLARDGGEWWDQLPSKDANCEALLGGYASTGPFTLPPLHDSKLDRQVAYQLALQTFANCLKLSIPSHIPALEEAHFSQPLYLQMSALIALRGERPESAEALTRAVLNHERRYWKDSATNLITPQFLSAECERQAALLMTLATLSGGIKIARDIESVWTAAGGDKALLKPLFQILVPLYPDKQGLQGLRPDLIGEALVIQILLGSDGEQILCALLSQPNQHWRHNTLTVLARALRNRDALSTVLETSLRQCFVNCTNEIIEVCTETPSPLPQISENAFIQLTASAKSQAAGSLKRHFSDEVLPLADLAVQVSQTIVEAKAKQNQKKSSLENLAEYACALSTFGVNLKRVGRNTDALGFAKQALDIQQKLAGSKPERFEPNYANFLSNYASHLSDLGRYEEALYFGAQALDIQKKLTESNPQRYEPDYATSLSNYASHLSDLGRYDEAFDFGTQALDIRKKLADNKPEKFEPNYATSLSNYAAQLSKLGRYDEALNFGRQALDIRKKLAYNKPERFEPNYAASLSNYAAYLSALGRYDEALNFDKQALDIRKKLAESKPERFEPDFADSLSNHASHLSNQGQYDDALDFGKQALSIRKKLAEIKPERFESDYANSLANYANQLANIGQMQGAVDNQIEASLLFSGCVSRMRERYVCNLEHSRLILSFWTWLLNATCMLPVLNQLMPEVSNARLRTELTFTQRVLIAFADPTLQPLKLALSSWNDLDKVQQKRMEDFYLVLVGLTKQRVDFDCDPDWSHALNNFKLQRQGRIPVWMEMTAQKLGFNLS